MIFTTAAGEEEEVVAEEEEVAGLEAEGDRPLPQIGQATDVDSWKKTRKNGKDEDGKKTFF